MNTAVRDTFERANIAARHLLTALVQADYIDPDTMTNASAPRPGSFQHALASLAVGESISKVRKLEDSIKLEDLQSEITGMKRTMGNALRNALVRAAETTGGEYSLRTGEMLTSPGEFWCVAIITRTA